MFSRSLVLIIVTFTLTFSFCGFSLASSTQNSENSFVYLESDAELAIVAAEKRILVSYQAVAKADDAGANTTKLLSVLDEAGNLLSKAKLAYNMGDFDSALNFALLGQERLNDFIAEADALARTAAQERYWDSTFNVMGSIVATVGVVCGGLIAWFFMEKKYEGGG